MPTPVVEYLTLPRKIEYSSQLASPRTRASVYRLAGSAEQKQQEIPDGVDRH
ncbi:MAG: hypothetical protein OSA08_01090 [Arenicellales bacterium]|nr:hypothetical protein [Arenicellales bacterium]